MPWPTLTSWSKANLFTITNTLTILARIVCWNFRSLFVFDSIFLAVDQSIAQRSLRSTQCRIHQNQDKYQKNLHVAVQIQKHWNWFLRRTKQVFSAKIVEFLPSFFIFARLRCALHEIIFLPEQFPKKSRNLFKSTAK